MDLERLHKLIEDDRLAEATGLLLATLQGTSLEKEARALRSRINDLERQVRQGLLGQEQAQIEKNRLRAAILDLAEDTGTPKDGLPKKNRRWWLLAGILLLPLSGVWLWLGADRDAGADADDRAATVAAALQTASVEFSRPVQLTEELEFRQVLAVMRRVYNWEVGLRFGVPLEQAEVVYADSTGYRVSVDRVRLSPEFSIGEKRSRTSFNSLWIEETSKDGEFWENINSLTEKKMDRRLRQDASLRRSILEQAQDLLRQEVVSLLAQDGTANPKVDIEISRLEMFDGQVIPF